MMQTFHGWFLSLSFHCSSWLFQYWRFSLERPWKKKTWKHHHLEYFHIEFLITNSTILQKSTAQYRKRSSRQGENLTRKTSKFFWFRIHNRPLILSLTTTVHSNNARLENRPPFLITKRTKQRKCVQESKTDGTKTSFRLQVCPYPNPFIEIKQLLPLLFYFVCLISFCLFFASLFVCFGFPGI